MTKQNPSPADDPRLSAYVLGELDDSERAAVEALLAESEEARREVEALREFTAELRDELGQEVGPGLRDEQRANLTTRLEHSPSASSRGWSKPLRLLLRRRYAAAAAVLLFSATGLAWWVQNSDRKETQDTQMVISAADPQESPRLPSSGTDYSYISDFDVAPDALVPTPSMLAQLEALGYMGGIEMTAEEDEEFLGVVVQRPNVAFSQLRALGYIDEDSSLAPRTLENKIKRVIEDRKKDLEELGYLESREKLDETATFAPIHHNPFVAVSDDPRSTFSLDVDTASYAIVRQRLMSGRLPSPDAVRIEELLNYFDYDYPPPTDVHPISLFTEVAPCPWQPEHLLLHVGLQARDVPPGRRPPANLVFLIDVSGSMNAHDKLPLLKASLRMLVRQLNGDDRVAMVVYAGAAGVVLDSTPANQRGIILAALDRLDAGGSTNGGEGIRLAYDLARANFLEGGINRVILATDGDFNVGVTHQGQLVELIRAQAQGEIYLSALGFGQGGYDDSRLEQIADQGDGHYAFIDSRREANRVLVRELQGTLQTVARDVKVQMEFNPAEVQSYRLIGYENRVLAHRDFNDDQKDAGDVGAGHSVTVLYEIVPAGSREPEPMLDDLKYQQNSDLSDAAHSGELLTLSLRYKHPGEDQSVLLRTTARRGSGDYWQASDDFLFSAAVAAYGMRLRRSPHAGASSFDLITRLAKEARGGDVGGFREEFLRLVERAHQHLGDLPSEKSEAEGARRR